MTAGYRGYLTHCQVAGAAHDSRRPGLDLLQPRGGRGRGVGGGSERLKSQERSAVSALCLSQPEREMLNKREGLMGILMSISPAPAPPPPEDEWRRRGAPSATGVLAFTGVQSPIL